MGFCRRGKSSQSALKWRQGKLAGPTPCTISLVLLRAFRAPTPRRDRYGTWSTLLGFEECCGTAAVKHNFLWMGVTPKETESRNLCLRLQTSETLCCRVGDLLDYPHHFGTATFMFWGHPLLLGWTRRGEDAVLLLWVLCMCCHRVLGFGSMDCWSHHGHLQESLLVEAASGCKAQCSTAKIGFQEINNKYLKVLLESRKCWRIIKQ